MAADHSDNAPDGKRSRQEDGAEPEMKRARQSSPDPDGTPSFTRLPADVPPAVSRLGLKPLLPQLPPSLELVTGSKVDLSSRRGFVGEAEVGILGYIGDPAFEGVRGVFKQRYTDFLVNEISLSGEILHLEDIAEPQEVEESAAPQEASAQPVLPSSVESDLPETLQFEALPDWPAVTTHALRLHLSDDTISSLHALLVEGRHVGAKADSGWGQRQAQQLQKSNDEEMALNQDQGTSIPAQGRQRGRGRGASSATGRNPSVDDREVVSQVIENKDARGAAHDAIRRLFKGIFESTARDTSDGQCIAIKWSSRKPGQQQRKSRSRLPPYIHFTLHKTNRETQDCLSHIARMIGVHPRELTVCGTKDKRAVTVQRVCLKRGNQSLLSVWNGVNGVKVGRRTAAAAAEERGERGTRIGDLKYSQSHLALGMLKGNHFTIVLRNVIADHQQDVDTAMQTIRDRGFINFFGMQRFGTSTVPTHVTGLLLLQQKWAEAIDSLLSLREGEHPDCTRGRLAWLEDKDVHKALEIMPRRCVAERAIWEHWKKGNRVEDRLGALGCIPRNLRTMYVHAYQSYIWNLVASERIKLSRTSPLAGDLVFVDGGDDDVDDLDSKHPETSSAREVKQLSGSEVAQYSLSDVVLPLPGWNVDYPEGAIGQLYEKILAADGLDPHRMRRDQREYSLPGSYRKLLHKPSNVSWQHIRYTDPDLSLSQSDEDRILGVNEPAVDDPNGKFQALKISWTLGTSSYATMALREITRQETATWNQINLTVENEDQAHRGSKAHDA